MRWKKELERASGRPDPGLTGFNRVKIVVGCLDRKDFHLYLGITSGKTVNCTVFTQHS